MPQGPHYELALSNTLSITGLVRSWLLSVVTGLEAEPGRKPLWLGAIPRASAERDFRNDFYNSSPLAVEGN